MQLHPKDTYAKLKKALHIRFSTTTIKEMLKPSGVTNWHCKKRPYLSPEAADFHKLVRAWQVSNQTGCRVWRGNSITVPPECMWGDLGLVLGGWYSSVWSACRTVNSD
ncbi:hypothetical protein V1524DRAFT_444205 [Lipomyces starkeyi]